MDEFNKKAQKRREEKAAWDAQMMETHRRLVAENEMRMQAEREAERARELRERRQRRDEAIARLANDTSDTRVLLKHAYHSPRTPRPARVPLHDLD